MNNLYLLVLFTLLFSSRSEHVFGSTTETKLAYIDEAVIGFPQLEVSSGQAYQLITHGRPGQLFINGEWKNAQQIAAFLAPRIKGENSTQPISAVNIYGCNFAQGPIGRAAVNYLERALGIAVAASDDITGRDGDWDLEVGQPVAAIAVSGYQGNLTWTLADTCATCDFDGDGIANKLDLDDDNDGVPDALEGCVTGNQVTFANVQDLSTNSGWTTMQANIVVGGQVVGTVKWQSNLDWTTNDVGRGTTYDGKYLFYGTATGVTGSVFDGALLTITPAAGYTFSGVVNFMENANLSSLNQANGYSSAGADNSGTFTHTFSTNADGSPINAIFKEYGPDTSYVGNYQTGDIFNNSSPIVNQQNALPQGTSGGSTKSWGLMIPFNATTSSPFTFNYYAPTNAVAWETNSINFDNLVVSCSNWDTDGDGLANQFDLDSDGDGCPDAKEASVSGTLLSGSVINVGGTTTMSNAIAQGTYGTNGLANSVETIDSSNAKITYNNTYKLYAIDSTISSFCTDSDGDGIADYYDLDDDNDGILDAVESPGCFYTQAEAQTIVSVTSDMITHTAAAPATQIPPGTNLPLLYDGNTAAFSTRILANSFLLNGMAVYTVKYNTPVNITSLTLVKAAQLTFDVDSYILQGSNDNSNWTTISNPTNDAAGNLALTNTSTDKFQYYRVLDYAHISGTNGDISQPASSTRYTSEIQVAYPSTGYIASANPKPTCTGSDMDGDGIPNYLDLDSDGDGCPDAIEGGAAFTSANLVNSSMNGGSTNIISNLGDSVGTSSTSIGVPTIANTGQTVGTSQDSLAFDPSCCAAGYVAPTITPTAATNTCPATTVDLNSLVSSTTPSGATLIWSTNNPLASANDTLTTAQASAINTADTYYAYYRSASAGCMTPADSIVVTMISCCSTLSPMVSGATTVTGSATYVASAINTSGMAYNGGTATITYNLSTDTTGVNPVTYGLTYPSSFTQTVTFTDVIPTDAIASPQTDFGYTNIHTTNQSTTGGLTRLRLEYSINPPTGTNLAKNINWVNSGLSSYSDAVFNPTYDNTVTGTAGVGPLTTPTYVANTSTTTTLNGNWVTSAQYKVTAGTQSALSGLYTYPGGNTWGHFNTGSGNGGTPVTSFSKTWSYDGTVQNGVDHAPSQSSTAEMVFAQTNISSPYTYTQGGVTNGLDFFDQTLDFSLKIDTVTNTCPATTVNLNSLVSNTAPSGYTLKWYTTADHSGTAYSTPTAATAGVYYSFFVDSANGCYSPAPTQVTVVIKQCPVLVPDINAGFVNLPITGNMALNDSLVAGSTFGSATAVTGNPSSALPTINSNGTYTFTTSVPGEYNFMVPVCPPGVTVDCPLELLTITVESPAIVNPPVVNTDVATTLSGNPVTIASLSNDQPGLNGNPLNPASVAVIGNPSHGTVSVNPTTGDITYTPAAGFVGIDTIVYTVCSQASPVLCDTAIQIVTVLPTNAPNSTNAADDYSATAFNTPVTGNAQTNDTDPEGNNQTVTAQSTTTAAGTFVIDTNGVYTFTPASGFSGSTSFTYQVCDNGIPSVCDSATIYITVAPPVMTTDPDINVGFVNVTITGSVSTNDNVEPGSTYGTPTAVSGNPNATLPTMNSDGTYTFNTTLPGVYQFMVPVCPPGVSTGCPLELLTITVQDGTVINPPIANTDVTTTLVNIPVTLATLANDKPSANGKQLDPSTVTVIDQPNNGTVTVNPLTGEITYTPNTGFVGIDTLKYEVCAEPTATNVVLCATAYQIITILPSGIANSTTAADDYNSTPINSTTSGNVKTNDHDPESNTQNITAQTTTTSAGTLTMFANGTYTFAPATGYTGTLAFPYQTCDNGTPQACDSATLYINVYGATALPVSLKRFYGHIQNELTTLNWEVSNEDHFSHYELERSNDGRSFEKIASINAIGSSNYAYNDNVAGLTGKVFYRLKMVDINSEFGYSNVLNFNIGKLNIQHIAPNPASSYFDVTVSCDEAANATMILTDLTGRKILSREFALTTGTQKLHVDNLGTLSNGVYTMTLIYGNQRFIGKVLIK